MECHAIFGPPGTGKTRNLEELVAEFSKSTDNIAVLSFTKAAAAVLTSRVKRENKLRFIGTNHALCYQTLGLERNQVAQVDTFVKWVDMDEQEVRWALNVGQYGRRNGLDLDSAYIDFASSRMDCPYGIVEFINETYCLWKKDNCLIDFDDMLVRATGLVDPFDIVVVDEAQDLSKVQWELITSMVAKDGRLIVAGDDDQSIFTWAGAYVHGMRDVADTKEVLSRSHRIPRSVHRLAERTIGQIANRQPKEYSPREEEGYVDVIPDYVVQEVLGAHGPHTVLCRDKWALSDIEADIVAMGIPYIGDGAGLGGFFTSNTARLIRAINNEDSAALIRSINRIRPEHREEVQDGKIPKGDWKDVIDLNRVSEEEITYLDLVDLDAEPGVTLSTIHSFKGREDGHVVLVGTCTQLVESAADSQLMYEDEVRVAYVGITRCKQGLTLVGTSPFIPM